MKNLIKIAIPLTAIGVAVKVARNKLKKMETKIEHIENLANAALINSEKN